MKGEFHQISVTVHRDDEDALRTIAKRMALKRREAKCEYCEEPYPKLREHGKYCSHKCRVLATRVRNKG